MSVIKVVLDHRLDDVDAPFAFEHANFVAGVHDQNYDEKDAAECPELRLQHIFAILNTQCERLTELVLVEQDSV